MTQWVRRFHLSFERSLSPLWVEKIIFLNNLYVLILLDRYLKYQLKLYPEIDTYSVLFYQAESKYIYQNAIGFYEL
ncbi:hypothetical protein [Nostoc sp.]|uniref:hypothetical protein n=1 Tax=Nostoc sp. TaxID=1180 RepID=UPI002FF920B0